MDSFPLFLVVTHFLNILLLTLLARSGLEVLSALPRLYASDDCPPGRELVRFSRRVVGADSRQAWTSLELEAPWSPVIALPGHKNLGIGRHWHFMTLQFWILTGVVYVVLLCLSGQWIRLVPTSWSIVPGAMHALAVYFNGHLAPPQPGLVYNAAQQLAYFTVVFLLAPLQIATGAAMSPSVIARFPWYGRLFGGKQMARTLHFLGLCAFGAFVVVHTIMVVLHGLPREWAAIALGSYRANRAVAVAVGLAALLVIVAVNVAVTVWALASPRSAQRLTGRLVDPFESALSKILTSRQRYRRAGITPYHWVNGRPPSDTGYREMARGGFRDYRLEIGGLVDSPRTLTLEQLRELGCESQVTKHNCIQGWTGIAEWGGVPLRKIVELVRPHEGAQRIVFYAYDDKGLTEGEGRYGQYYGSIPLHLALKPQTILALEMNGEPLPIEHGAPVRLRVETQLGFKMVKWIRKIEFTEGYEQLGAGMGGWREDQQYYANAAGI
ncbi:MAG: molybdopterin-dependent oxidoreductase [Candidatus Dormibacteraceae bacterium]